MAERRRVVVDLVTRTQGGTKGISSLKRELGGVDTGAGKANKSLKNLGSGGSVQAQRGLKGLVSGAGGARFAMGGLAAGGLAVGAGLKASIDAFASFDDKMAQSRAIMGQLSDDQMARMESAARDVAKTTRLSADAAAESYFFLASAGLDAEQSIAALPQVASFAQAGMFDMATATDLLTDAQSSLGLTSDDSAENLMNMTKVSDVFVKANQLANTSVQQVSEAITNKLGGSLRAAGIDIEEGVAVLAAFADQGLKGAAAGEAMNIALRDLSKAARDNESAFEAAGIEVFDQEGNFRNMADIIQDLEGAFGGLTAEQKANLAAQLGFQDRSFKNIQLLLGTSEAVRGYEKDLRSAGGATQEVADNQLDSFSGQMDLVKSQLTDAGITIGEALAPSVLSLAKGFTGLITAAGPLLGLLGKLMSIGLKPLSFILERSARGLEEITALFDPAAKSALNLKKAIEEVNNAGEDGQDKYDAFANGLAHLARTNALTEDSFLELATAAGVTAEQWGGAVKSALDLAEAEEWTAETTLELKNRLMEAVEASDLDAEAKQNLIREYGLLTGEVDSADKKFMGYSESAEDAADATGDVGDEVDTTTDQIISLEDALAAAEAAQTSLADAMRSFADPTFAAVNAVQNLQEKQRELAEAQEDGESSAEELAEKQLEVAKAVLEAQGALDAFSAGNIEEQIGVVAAALGISDQEARELLATLGILDGTSVNADATVVFTAAGSKTAMAAASGATDASVSLLGGFRAAGGPVSKDVPFIVGEKGPELFVPESSGRIVPNNQLAAAGGSTTNNNERNIEVKFVNSRLADNPMKALRSALAFDQFSGSF